jgi:hypothetical protein
MLVRAQLAALLLCLSCASSPRVYPAELHVSLAYLITHQGEFARGQAIAVYGHLYDGWLYLTKENALAGDILSAIVVANPFEDQSFRDSECDAQFVQVFGELDNPSGEEWILVPTHKVEVPALVYPPGSSGDWQAELPTVCFEANTPPAV